MIFRRIERRPEVIAPDPSTTRTRYLKCSKCGKTLKDVRSTCAPWRRCDRPDCPTCQIPMRVYSAPTEK